MALIENAADVCEADAPVWVEENREALIARGYQIEQVDLRTYKGNVEGLREKLAAKDALWLGGGNTFYLRWILKDTGADVIIKKLVTNGMVYGGGSAGAVVAGPTLKYFEDADDPNDSPEVILEGLHLTEAVVVPHAGGQEYGEAMKKIDGFLTSDGYETIPLTDAQAVILYDEEDRRIIPR